MFLPVALRSDYDAVRLRQLARRSKDAPQTRRLLALAVIYEGGSRTQAAEMVGLAYKPCVIGYCASMPMGPMGSWMARRQIGRLKDRPPGHDRVWMANRWA